jgi:hypothetical protein
VIVGADLIEPMAENSCQYGTLMRGGLNDLSFAPTREVLDALQARFTLEKEGEGELRNLLVLPTSENAGFCTTLRRASA